MPTDSTRAICGVVANRVREQLRRQPMLPLAASAVVMIGVDQMYRFPLQFWLAAIAAVTMLLSWSQIRVRRYDAAQPRPAVVPLAVILLVGCIFALRHCVVAQTYDASLPAVVSAPPDTNQIDQSPAIITGRLVDIPRLRRTYLDRLQRNGDEAETWQTRLLIDVQQIRDGYEDRRSSGRWMAMVDGDRSELRIGDSLTLYGSIAEFTAPGNPGVTDLRDWARRSGLHGILRVDAISSQRDSDNRDPDSGLDSGPSWAPSTMFWRWIGSLAVSGRQILMNQVGEDQGPLAMALVLGQRDLLEPAVRDRLLVTGTAHLLSVSGLHLAIVVWLARGLACLFDCSLRTQMICMVVVGGFYVALTGGRPPVIRSALLLSTLLLSLLARRTHEPINALSLAALVLAWCLPTQVFGVGVLLSFVAVATLLQSGRGLRDEISQAMQREARFDEMATAQQSLLQRWLRWIVNAIGQSIWLSGCVTAMTLPIVWHQFHVISWVSVVVNVLLSSLMIAALASGIATVLAGWVGSGLLGFASLAAIPGQLCQWVLTFMNAILVAFENVPWGHVWLPAPPTAMVILFYIVVIVCWLTVSVSRRWRWLLPWVLVWLAAAGTMSTRPASLPTGTLELTFIDVGHGTAVVVRDQPSRAWLYDCGWMGNAIGSSREIDQTLWSMGLTRLSAVYLSHADADHFNALPGLARRFAIDRIVTPPGMLAESESALNRIRQTISDRGIPVVEVSRESSNGHALPTNSPFQNSPFQKFLPESWQVLHPPAARLAGSDNANSLVLRIDHRDQTILLPGDLEPPGTAEVINQARPRPGGLLMAPHHGSLQMDAEQVLQWARPRLTVVSGGRRAGRIEVREMLQQVGGDVMVTSIQGAIRVRMAADGTMTAQAWREDPW